MRPLQSFNYWNNKRASSKINVECFLPNGMFISFHELRADTTLDRIKDNLWNEATRSSLFRLLRGKEEYCFSVVSPNGGSEELIDESQSLFDVKPVRPYLKIVRRQGDEAAKLVNSKINILIGKTVTPDGKNEEVDDMRKKIIPYCEKVTYQRGSSSWEHRAIYTYPPEFAEAEELPQKLLQKIEAAKVMVSVSMMSANSSLKNICKTIEINRDMLPSEVIEQALRKRSQTLNVPQTEKAEDYVLKVCGRFSFFLGVFVMSEDKEVYVERALLQYKYIRLCIMYDKKAKLIIVPKHELDVGQPLIGQSNSELPPIIPMKEKKQKIISLWNLTPAHKLKIKVTYVMNLNAGHNMWKEVVCGIYHGGEAVCEDKTTSMKQGAHPRWSEYLEFDISVKDLPRMARYSFSIVGYDQKDKARKKPTLIAWVNVPIFNYKGMLRQGQDTLCCWQHNTSMDSSSKCLAHPLRTVSQNKNESGTESGAASIGVEFMKFDHPVMYPTDDTVFDLAAKTMDANHSMQTRGGKMLKEVQDVIKRDVLVDMLEEEKELLWQLKVECFHEYPDSLPKLLQCVKWSSPEHVCQIRILLQSWQDDTLEIEIALDLLDYKFPDPAVRKLAVKVLDRLTDNQLEMYLLHLVHALKYESYLNSDLAQYLLKRALNNRRIGHYLFWHLKAEVNNPELSLQFGLLLELYCRGAREHINILLKQVECINKLKTVTEVLQSGREGENEKKKLSLMRECFNGNAYMKAFSNVFSPLDPSVKLKSLRVNNCKFMDSKKKPLWLVFENSDEEGEDYLVIFKNGDDLRQDVLTLTCMRLMDAVWKKAGYDYGMNIYNCLPTGPMLGLIEVVRGSTLGEIQASKGGSIRGVWKETNLFSYLEEKAETAEKCKQFIENFTSSVVGYSIATYVLGIGDRHNDNIMIKSDSGELFHIDFGHFLGNFKSKYGIKREFVKFVLTDDILYIINKLGEDGIQRFRNSCIEAYKTLRSKGNLFISVFAMLLSCGIPELEVPRDLDYLQQTLAMTESEPDAVKNFEKSFKEAIENKFLTTGMWWMHNLAHRWISD